ncbi:MAG: NAD-dependent epimerase/dehydratase family protein [bacterium]
MTGAGRFQGTRVVVTGAGGFIGGAVCAALVAERASVAGLDVSVGAAERVAGVGAEPFVADVSDRGAVAVALDGAEIVVHAAAHVHEWGSMEEFVRVNVAGTAAMLDAAREAGVDRFVQISSVVVYGYDHAGEQDEDVFRRAYGIPYIDTKSASDRLAARRGAVVIRPGDVYGPRSIPWIVRPLELARRGALAVPSPGDGVMLPVYIDDLVEAVLLGADAGLPGRAYAAWEGTPVAFADDLARIAEIAGGAAPRTLPRPILEAAGAATELVARLRGRTPAFTSRAPAFVDRRGTVSTERIRTELGWEPQVGLAEGLRRSAEWARAEGLA